MKIKMNFRNDFSNIERGEVLDSTHGVALRSAMERSSEWRSHVSNCKDAKVLFLNVGGERVITSDERNKLFDNESWRKNLEEKSSMMLKGDREDFSKEISSESALKSENFLVGSFIEK